MMETEGLFVKNYLGTVSAVSRPRTGTHMETRSTCLGHGPEHYQKYKNQSLGNGVPNHAKVIYELGGNKEKETDNGTEIINHRNETGLVEEEKDKKKEKKWTLGGFFRRKNKKDDDDSSEDSEEETKRGFLSRRKSKREGRKAKARSTANGFDVVIPQQKDKTLPNGVGLTAEQLWSGESKVNPPRLHENGPIRYIHRHPNSGPEIAKTNASLHVPKHSRKDSSLSRSSNGSENLEGRKGRKEVMARAEAKRDMMRDESSSDENDSYHSNSSLNRLSTDPSHREGHRRLRRSNKRLSRDEEPREADLWLIKSDFEGGRRLPSNNRWMFKANNPNSSDLESNLNLLNHSGTPSPSRSPRARQRQLLHYMSIMQNSYPTSTFPPAAHFQQSRNSSHHVLSPNRNLNFTKEHQVHGSQPLMGINYRNLSHKGNRNSDFVQNLPRSLSNVENSANRRTLTDYEHFLSSCSSTKEKSFSFDDDIHRASYFENESAEGQLPTEKSSFNQSSRRMKPDMVLGDEKKIVYNVNVLRERTLKSFENGNGISENRTESTPSLSIQSGIFPQQPTQIVQRSSSGNSFCNSHSNFNQNRSNSYHFIPNSNLANVTQNRSSHLYRYPTDSVPKRNPGVVYWSQDETPKSSDGTKDNFYLNKPPLRETVPPNGNNEISRVKPVANGTASILRYYADQNPRSRNPIHITCNPMTNSNTNGTVEQPYLSDSQVVVKPIQARSASDFWKLKDREAMLKSAHKRAETSFLKPPLTQAKPDRSRSTSPRPNEATKPSPEAKSLGELGRVVNGNMNHSDFICSDYNLVDCRNNRKILKEEYNVAKVNKTPPEPPVRRLSKQEVLARLQKCELLKNKEHDLKELKNEARIHSGNLDEALNELEIIYNSLRLKDEDLVDRAERRDLPIYRPNSTSREYNSVAVRDKIENFYAESDFSTTAAGDSRAGHQRALPLRKSGIPDKTTDDMAFRRMNSRERNDIKKFPSQSYLRSSPALSPVFGASSATSQKDEPDITQDDVVFRNIRHANSTLKVQDPQPPFGIPIGVITPAPNSDYLHATPKERFRPTFTSSKTPDVVKDDLAFRNLRKDNKTSNCLVIDPDKNDTKKRAVRSLSANLYNIMQKYSSNSPIMETNNNEILEKSCEKAQSLTDLSNGKWSEKQTLEKRLKQLKEEKNAKRAEFFELSQELRKRNRYGSGNRSWTDLANLTSNFENISEPGKLSDDLQKKNIEDLGKSSEKKSLRSPVVELSKYPAAAPSSSLQGNPFKEVTSSSPVDEEQLESLLSALAAEAKNASKDLERQLDQLGSKVPSSESKVVHELKSNVFEEFNLKFKANSLGERNKRRRNLSLSNGYEPKEETRKTGSLERRKGRRQSSSLVKSEDIIQLEELLRQGKHTSELKKTEEEEQAIMLNLERSGFVSKEAGSTKSDAEKQEIKVSTTESSSRERRQSQTFRVVTDLSQILHEVEQHLNEEIAPANSAKKEATGCESKDVFQEVYEYNCRLANDDGKTRGSDDFSVSSPVVDEMPLTLDTKREEDIEKEFEKLHQEVNSSTKETKEPELQRMDELIAEVTSVEQSAAESLSSFPFPNEGARGGFQVGRSSSGSSKGEGEAKSPSLRNELWLACTYALAFAFHLQEMDFLTALGIVLAVISIVAFLVL